MRLLDVLDNCCVKTVTVSPEINLAEAAQAMLQSDATVLIVKNSRFQGVLVANDILRCVSSAVPPTHAWLSPVSAALCEQVATVSAEDLVDGAIEKMTTAGLDHLPVTTAQGIVVISLCRLLLAENALLHGEVRHLQNYIDALHDAPSD